MAQHPKFEQKLTERVVQPQMEQTAQAGYGIVYEYDSFNNTATVVMANRGSDDVGDLYRNVPCPVQLGVQNVAPEPGRPCWVAFKDNSPNFPIIVTYFNHVYAEVDYQRQTKAVTTTPRYMFDM